jgi:hypothetical protein
MAEAVSSAAVTSLIDGSDFGDNVIAALPSAIASVLGPAISEAIANACFVAGTPVMTVRGLVPIEEIRAGDIVFARDEHGRDQTIHRRRVLETYQFRDKATLSLHLAAHTGNTTITTTPLHPFAVEDSAGNVVWTAAEDLKLGDAIIVKDAASPAIVTAIEPEGGLTTVYNFAVDVDHTYFIGEAGLWVHNNCGPEAVAMEAKLKKLRLGEGATVSAPMARDAADQAISDAGLIKTGSTGRRNFGFKGDVLKNNSTAGTGPHDAHYLLEDNGGATTDYVDLTTYKLEDGTVIYSLDRGGSVAFSTGNFDPSNGVTTISSAALKTSAHFIPELVEGDLVSLRGAQFGLEKIATATSNRNAELYLAPVAKVITGAHPVTRRVRDGVETAIELFPPYALDSNIITLEQNGRYNGQTNAGKGAPQYKKWVAGGGTLRDFGNGQIEYQKWIGMESVRVMYTNGIPDFTPHAIRVGGQASIRVDGMTGELDSRLATSAARQIDGNFSKPNKTTWHHVSGGTHMMLLPRAIHEGFVHHGGASDIRNGW